jgi:hypothetical protein
MKQEEKNAIRVAMIMNDEGERGRGRPKKGWLDTIENDMSIVGVCIGDVENRDE